MRVGIINMLAELSHLQNILIIYTALIVSDAQIFTGLILLLISINIYLNIFAFILSIALLYSQHNIIFIICCVQSTLVMMHAQKTN